MRLNVEWTLEAEATFDDIIQYLRSEFGETSADNFITRVQTVLSEISVYPELFQSTKINNTRKGFISRQTSLYYRIIDDRIELLSFWNNKNDQDNKKW